MADDPNALWVISDIGGRISEVRLPPKSGAARTRLGAVSDTIPARSWWKPEPGSTIEHLFIGNAEIEAVGGDCRRLKPS
jgi:hypothetical protein